MLTNLKTDIQSVSDSSNSNSVVPSYFFRVSRLEKGNSQVLTYLLHSVDIYVVSFISS